MPAAKSKDLREVVVAAREAGETIDSVAATYQVGTATVKRWLRLKRTTGQVMPLPKRDGPIGNRTPEKLVLLRAIVDENPDGTREEFARAWGAAIGESVSVATVGRGLRDLGYTRKKSGYTQPSETNHTS